MATEENKRQSVKLERPTLIQGGWMEKGDSVEVYPFQKRHMVEAGFATGGVEDIASPGEKEVGALNVLKRADERDDIDVWSVQRAHEEGWGYGDTEADKASNQESGTGSAQAKSK